MKCAVFSRRMRRRMAGHKPDIGDVAGAMLLFAASAHDIDAVVALYLT
jgi:hypothetical protein